MRAVFKLMTVAVMAAMFFMTSTFASATTPPWLSYPTDGQMIVMGGVDDPNADDNTKRVADWSPNGDIVKVSYPAAMRPHGGSTSYDDSVRLGKQNVIAAIKASNAENMVVVSISQGGRAVGDVANELDTPEYEGRLTVVSLGEPRFKQTGIETVYEGFSHDGMTATGERPTTEHVEYISVCVKGDPVCSGTSGLLVDAFGFVCTHGGNCPGINYNYANLDQMEVAATHTEGNTTHVLVDAPHPGVQIAEASGVTLDAGQIALLEQLAPVAVPQF